MDIKDILLPVRPEHDERAASALAARLALRYGARVQGLCLTPLPALTGEDCYALGEHAVHEVMTRMDQEAQRFRSEAGAVVRAAMTAAGCDWAWSSTPPGEIAAETALRARLFDLVVLTRPSHSGGADLRLEECMARLGGAPCLVVPAGIDPERPFGHVVLAWNGSRQAKRAMDDALPFLKAAERVSVVVVGHAEDLGDTHDGLLGHLKRKGVNAAIEFVGKGREGVAGTLLAWCAAHRADLLVMGAFGHRPQTERWLGGTTWTALTSAQLPVLMSC